MMNSDHRGNDDIGVSCGTNDARAESSAFLARRSHQSCGGLAQSACLVLHHQVKILTEINTKQAFISYISWVVERRQFFCIV